MVTKDYMVAQVYGETIEKEMKQLGRSKKQSGNS